MRTFFFFVKIGGMKTGGCKQVREIRHYVGYILLALLYGVIFFGHTVMIPGFTDWNVHPGRFDYPLFLYYLIFLVVMFLNPLRLGRIDLTLSLAALIPMFLSFGTFWTFLGLWIALFFRLYQRGVSLHRWVYLQNIYGWAYVAAVLSYVWAGGTIQPDHVGVFDLLRGFLFAFVFYSTNVLLVIFYSRLIYHQPIRLTPLYGWIAGSALISVAYGELSYWITDNLSLTWGIALALPLIVIIYLTRYYYELYYLVHNIKRVHELSKRLFEARRLTDVLHYLNDALRSIIEYDRMMVCLKADSFQCYGDQDKADNPDHLTELPAAQANLLREITETYPSGRFIFDDGAVHHAPLPAPFAEVKAALVLPLQDVSEPEAVVELGWISLCRVTRHPFSETEEQLGRMMAVYAVPAIQRAMVYERDERSSLCDALTGIPLYRAVYESLEGMLQKAAEHNEPLSVIMLDLDYFKKVNDTFGHEAGNEVLKETVRRIKHHIRANDLFCRYGGEEFLLVLPQTTAEEALRLAERIRSVLEHEACRYHPYAAARDGGDEGTIFIRVTASLGIATFPEDGEDLNALIGQADRAMYVGAKRRGRNRVALASGFLS